jgi:hypothetical protein
MTIKKGLEAELSSNPLLFGKCLLNVVIDSPYFLLAIFFM